jgi:stress response protein YsnF
MAEGAARAAIMRTVVGLFDDRNEAKRAYTTLVEEGFAKADLDILTSDDEEDVHKLAHLRARIPEPDVNVYLDGLHRGGTIITANVAGSASARAAEILSGYVMVNIKKRLLELQKTHKEFALLDPATSENVLEVIEEELDSGKEPIERGRMRIYSLLSERAGQRDETLKVRRRPVNKSVSINPDLFKERAFEMFDKDEIAKVGKTARVLEEVSLGKEVAEKVQTIKEALRRRDVEVEEIPAARPLQEYLSDFRNFYTKNLASSGATFENLSPAFLFGYGLATREPFRSAPWSAVEADSRRIWEEKNPGTWDKNMAVIKYAWARVRDAR